MPSADIKVQSLVGVCFLRLNSSLLELAKLDLRFTYMVGLLLPASILARELPLMQLTLMPVLRMFRHTDKKHILTTQQWQEFHLLSFCSFGDQL